MVRYTPMRAPLLDTSSRAAFALGSAACVGALTFGATRYIRHSRLLCSAASSSERVGEDLQLAEISVGASHVLLTSPWSVAFSGLQPIVPGHCVVAPLRPVGRAPELSDAEWLDLWRTARRAQAAVEGTHAAGASNLLLKDGTARLPHLHVHVVPRLPGDFAVSDQVFDAMDGWAPTAAAAASLPAHVKLPLLADHERKDRTPATMADEAAAYRALALAGAAAKPKVAAHTFARFPIAAEHVFLESPSGLSVAFVNLRPLVAGHVLVTPRRIVPRMHELSEAEAGPAGSTVPSLAATHATVPPWTAPQSPARLLGAALRAREERPRRADAEERQGAAALWCLPKVADFHRLLTLQADDLWLLVREVQRVLQARYKPRGFEFGVQDGKLAGQSVPHVHVHVLPNGHV